MPESEITIDQGVDGLLAGMGDPAEQPQAAEAEVELSDTEAQSDETSGAVEADEAEVSEGESDDVEETEGDEETEELYTVLVDGKEETVRLSDLTSNYKRQKSLDRQIHEAKQRQEAFDQQRQQAAEEARQTAEARQRYIEVIEATRAKLGSLDEVPEPPEEMRQTDPIRYQELKIQAIEHRERIRGLEEERNREMQAQYAEQAKHHRKRLGAERDMLLQKIPEWQDQDVYTRESTEVRNYAMTLGFTEMEASTVADHRAVEALRKAMMYDKMMETGKPTVAQKVKQAAPTIKKGRTVSAKPKNATQKAFDRFAKVAKSGSDRRVDAVDAAVDFLMQGREAKR
jgi:hypothetical protein